VKFTITVSKFHLHKIRHYNLHVCWLKFDCIMTAALHKQHILACDWLKQLKRFTAVLAVTKQFWIFVSFQFRFSLFQFYFSCISIVRALYCFSFVQLYCRSTGIRLLNSLWLSTHLRLRCRPSIFSLIYLVEDKSAHERTAVALPTGNKKLFFFFSVYILNTCSLYWRSHQCVFMFPLKSSSP